MRLTVTATERRTSGIPADASGGRRQASPGERSTRALPPSDLRLQPLGGVRRCGAARRLPSTAGRSRQCDRGRSGCTRLGTGPRRPLHLQPGPTTDRGGNVPWMQRASAGRVRPATARCSFGGRWRRLDSMSAGRPWISGMRRGLLPNTNGPADSRRVIRGVGPTPPPGGYQPADMIFFGHGAGNAGHVALYLGGGLIVQCSLSANGSNVRPLVGYVTPTGWVRWRL